MDQLIDFFSGLFSTELWPARWSCGTWTSFHGWLYVISSLLIASAYFLIPIFMARFMRHRKDLPFVRIFWLFILFILACGTTHLLDAVIFWYPMYRFSAVLLFITALVSWAALLSLRKVIPVAMELKSPQQLEKIIHKRTLQLRETNISLKRMNDDLDTYVYAASHDLKSPINNMEGLIAVIRDEIRAGKLPPEIILEKLDESVARVHSTISRLTDVVKLQKSPYDDIKDNDIRQLFHSVLTENAHLLEKNRATVKLETEMETLRYSTSGLKSILYNLIVNAVKYCHSERDCEVNVRFFIEKNKVCLEVTDNGIGIDLDRFGDRIFGLFKRFHSHVEGSGIGLYSIRQLIIRKGGSISVTSQPNVGSCFKVIF